MTARRLSELTWPEVETAGLDVATATLLVPLGATEQHGPHLTLGADTEIAVALAGAAATRMPDAIVAPALPYGASGEHQDFAGTLSIGAEATELVLVELGRSACATFRRVLFVCAHGGNAAALGAAVARLRNEGRDVRSHSPRWGGDAHAGRTETSLMLVIDDSQVRRAQAEAGNETPLPTLIGSLREEGVRAVSPNGVLGDPGSASREQGQELFDVAVDDLVAMLANWSPDPSERRRR